MKITWKSVKRTIIALSCVLLLICIVLGLGYAGWQWDKTVVTVANRSGQAVDNVEIKLDNGGVYALGLIRPGEAHSARINIMDPRN